MSNSRKSKSSEVAPPARSKSSIGFRPSRSSEKDVPARSMTPAVGSSSSRYGDKGRRSRKRGAMNSMATIDDVDEDAGGVSLGRPSGNVFAAEGVAERWCPPDDGYGSLSRPSVFDDGLPIRYNETIIPDHLNPSTDEFFADEAHLFWKWSVECQNWYHQDEQTGAIVWDRPLT